MAKYEKIDYDSKIPTKLYDFFIIDNTKSFIDKHWHNAIEIVMPFYGTARMWLNGQDIFLKPMQAYIINTREVHGFYPVKENRSDYYYKGYALQINYDFLKNCYKDIDKIYFKQPDEKTNVNITKIILDIIRYYDSDDAFNDIRITGLVQMLCYELLHNLAVSNETIVDVKDNKHTTKLLKILKYIDDNYKEYLSSSIIAEEFQISEGYLYRLFRDNINMTLKEYIDNTRLKNAINDVVNTRLPIIDVAINNGFPNAKSFNNVFKKRYGVTPAKYRKNTRE